MMSKKNIISTILIILVLGVYYYFKSEPTSDKSSFDMSQSPIFKSEHMLTTVYDISGTLIYKISANTVEHFDDVGDTFFGSPLVILYDQNKNPSWNIIADQAELTKSRTLFLKGNVQFNNLAAQAQLERIKTDNAKVDLIAQVITSEDQVTIQGPGFYSTGVGLQGDLKDKTAHLLDNVKTFYHHPQSNRPSETN